jgi:hypothetical protein
LEPNLSEEDRAFVNGFFHELLLMLPLLGFREFLAPRIESDVLGDGDDASLSETTASSSSGGKRAELYTSLPQGMSFYLKTKGVSATLEVCEGGVVVKAGSYAVHPVSEMFEVNAPAYAANRQQLVESGILLPKNGGLVFTADQFFSSGSAASTVIRGSNSNSDWWKAGTGKSLGDYIREVKAR